jgi:hypothetical protein
MIEELWERIEETRRLALWGLFFAERDGATDAVKSVLWTMAYHRRPGDPPLTEMQQAELDRDECAMYWPRDRSA